MNRKRIKLQDFIPVIAFVVIFAFFSVVSKGKMLSAYNLQLLLEQSIIPIILGCGVIFVVAQGSIDLTVGVNLALSGVIGVWAAAATGIGFLLIPVALAVGTIVGLFNGFIVSKFKVPSFMLSIAMLIGVRGIVNFIQTKIGIQYLPSELSFLNQPYVKIPIFIVIVLIMAYLFEFTKCGRYSKAIGENEVTTKFVGVPVSKIKVIAFALSGLMAGAGALFSVITVGATSNQMGLLMEMKVAMAMFFGGILVTGGSSAKIFKVILGTLSIMTIEKGLAIIGMGENRIYESVEGLLLLIVLFITIIANSRHKKGIEEADVAGAVPPSPAPSGVIPPDK